MFMTAAISHIPVRSATGSGRTGLAAFHAALVAAGVGHYNLIRLSSVVPPGSRVVTGSAVPLPTGTWGDRLYCVYADCCATSPGEHAWAGVGWVQRADGGGGLFVEHTGTSEAQVTALIENSLRDFVTRHGGEYPAPEWVVRGAVCTGDPVCVLVLAAYEVEPWGGARACQNCTA